MWGDGKIRMKKKGGLIIMRNRPRLVPVGHLNENEEACRYGVNDSGLMRRHDEPVFPAHPVCASIRARNRDRNRDCNTWAYQVTLEGRYSTPTLERL